MNALAIHLYLTITFINLVIIRLAQNYRIIVFIINVRFTYLVIKTAIVDKNDAIEIQKLGVRILLPLTTD